MLKFALFLMMLHVLPETHFSNAQSYRKDWLLSAPAKVRATRGSCVVIPCSFSPPKAYPTYSGLLVNGLTHVTVAQSGSKLPNEDELRFRFLGSMNEKNCTWMLWDVRDSDAGIYLFRLGITGFSYTWSYQPTVVQVVGVDDPVVEVVDGKIRGEALAYCSVFYSCPQNPPSLKWNNNGTTLTGSTWVDTWQWMTYSVLHFRPQQNTPIICTVKH